MNDDTSLLREYVREGSEPAFRGLVERHIALVNSTARRMVGGDVHLAQDVTQLVFTDLVRKAAALPEGVVLGGWLHRHTCFAAAKAVRTECRRRARERIAMELHTLHDNSGQDDAWQQLAPVLDDALNRLSAGDRDAIVLRYLQHHDLRSIGAALGVSDDTVQKRISRALEKLRGILTRRGITLSTALLATTLNAGAAPTVSSGLAATVSATAISSSAKTAAFTLTSLHAMIATPVKLGFAAAAVLAGITLFLHRPSSPAAAPIPSTQTSAVAASSSKANNSTPISPASAVNGRFGQVENPRLPPAAVSNAAASTEAPDTVGDPFTSPNEVSITAGTPSEFMRVPTAVPVLPNAIPYVGHGTLTLNNTIQSDRLLPLVQAGDSLHFPNEIMDNGDGTLTLTLQDGTIQTFDAQLGSNDDDVSYVGTSTLMFTPASDGTTSTTAGPLPTPIAGLENNVAPTAVQVPSSIPVIITSGNSATATPATSGP